MRQNKLYTCRDFWNQGCNCCATCHNEWEIGYGEPMDGEFENGNRYEVCCYIYFEIKDGKVVEPK